MVPCIGYNTVEEQRNYQFLCIDILNRFDSDFRRKMALQKAETKQTKLQNCQGTVSLASLFAERDC